MLKQYDKARHQSHGVDDAIDFRIAIGETILFIISHQIDTIVDIVFFTLPFHLHFNKFYYFRSSNAVPLNQHFNLVSQ